MNAPTITQLLIEDVKRRLIDESLPRIRKCLDQLTEEETWQRPNENLVSVGNLVLHLNGNLRQWVLSTLGGQPDDRQRQKEFDAEGPLPITRIINDLEKTITEISTVLDNCTEEDLNREYTVQGFKETGVSILVHVTEHMSYHVGQMVWYVKFKKNIDLGFYAGKNLDIRS